jgi:hypothetical protein
MHGWMWVERVKSSFTVAKPDFEEMGRERIGEKKKGIA